VSEVSNMGPWSIDWLPQQKPISEEGVVFSSTSDVRKSKQVEHVHDKSISPSGNVTSKKKKVGVVHNSVGFMKKIARMPAKDRNQILKILKKQKRKRKVYVANVISVKKELNRLYILGTLITWFASYPAKCSQILKNHSIMLFTSNANSL